MKNESSLSTAIQAPDMQRRKFLGLLTGSAAVLGFAAACNKNDNPTPSGGIDLGSGDIGVLNYAYALEQLEAAFYIQVITTQYAGITTEEVRLLTDIRDHEIAHREFFRNALGASAIVDLEVDFSAIDFTSKASVLGSAKTFEDTGVSAYNGAGKLIVDPNYLLVAGKIVSVEARHAAYIRDLLLYGDFAGTTDASGLDLVSDPGTVLAAVSPFLKSTLDGSHLPTN